MYTTYGSLHKTEVSLHESVTEGHNLQQNSRGSYCGRPQQLGMVPMFAPSEMWEPYSGGKAFVPCAFPDLDLPSDTVREVETHRLGR